MFLREIFLTLHLIDSKSVPINIISDNINTIEDFDKILV